MRHKSIPKDYPHYHLRLRVPAEVMAYLEDRAKGNGRSVSAEISHMMMDVQRGAKISVGIYKGFVNR